MASNEEYQQRQFHDKQHIPLGKWIWEEIEKNSMNEMREDFENLFVFPDHKGGNGIWDELEKPRTRQMTLEEIIKEYPLTEKEIHNIQKVQNNLKPNINE